MYLGTFIPIFRPIGPFPRIFLDVPSKIFFQIAHAKNEKNAVFWPKKGKKWAKFFKILEFDKSPINTSYVQILGHLDHFLLKYDNFLPFLAHFCPIII